MNIDNINQTRFWQKVNKDCPSRCWEWTAGCCRDGYGSFHVDMQHRGVGAHRISWILHTGRVPTLSILHSCDNPKCVNPEHLREGTQVENMADRTRRGRTARHISELNGRAKITFELAETIRNRYVIGNIQQSELALEYGLAQSSISRIILKKAYTKPPPTV